MENIMIAVITSTAAVITAIVSAISAKINSRANKNIQRQNELLEESKRYTDTKDKKIYDKIQEMDNNITEELKKLQISECKNYLVGIIDRIGNGDKPGDVAKQLFYEKYDTYTQLGQNSYVHAAIEEIQEEHKL